VGLPEVIQVSVRPAGGGWSAPEPVSEPTHDSVDVHVAMDPKSGAAVLVWQQYDGSGFTLRATQRTLGGSWSAPVVVSAPGQNAQSPRVGFAGGVATALWLRSDGSVERTEASSALLGGSWSAPVYLSAPGYAASEATLAVEADGTARALWSRIGTTSYVIQAVTLPPGGTWSQPVVLTPDGPGFEAIRPSIAVDPVGGGVFAAWDEQIGATQVEAQVAHSTPSGSWTSPEPVGEAAPGSAPALGVDGVGDAVAVFPLGNVNPTDLRARALDVAGPSVTGVTAPATATAGQSASFSATATDVWSAVTSYAWSFGDGATASGASPTHTYATPGTYPVSLTVTDAVGNSTTRTATTTVAAPVPAIGVFKLTKTKVAAARTIARRTKLKVGLNTAAVLKLVIKSRHRHLVKGKKKFLKVVLRKQVPAGLSRITIKAKLKGIRLKPDTYVITGVATNATGHSTKKKTKLLVVRP
jgi:hypothetical protein